MLDVQALCIAWRGDPVIADVTFSVSAGEIVALTGANGSGKSSLIAGLAGLDPVERGTVLWEGRNVTRHPLHARNGMAVVPEGRRLAPSLTVLETLRLGAGRKGRRGFQSVARQVLARLPVLADRLDQAAGTLSGGEAQMLSLARALMCEPRLLFLDEPTLGLSPAAARSTFDTLRTLQAEGMSMVLTDQDSRATSALADRTFQVADHRLKPAPAAPCTRPTQGGPR